MTFREKLRIGVLTKKFYRKFREINKTLAIKETQKHAIHLAKEIVRLEKQES